jgi:hypothetical protein
MILCSMSRAYGYANHDDHNRLHAETHQKVENFAWSETSKGCLRQHAGAWKFSANASVSTRIGISLSAVFDVEIMSSKMLLVATRGFAVNKRLLTTKIQSSPRLALTRYCVIGGAAFVVGALTFYVRR